MQILVRSHEDTSGFGGLAEGLHNVNLGDLAGLETFILDGRITFPLPIKDLTGLNSQINAQIYYLYRQIASQSRTLFDFYTNRATTGTAEESLYDGVIDAGDLSNDGDKVEAFFSGGISSAFGNLKIIRVYFAGTLVAEISSTNIDLYWLFDIELIRSANDTVKISVDSMIGSSPMATYAEVGSLDLAASAYSLELRAETADGAGDVTAKMGNGIFFPAADVPLTPDNALIFNGNFEVFNGDYIVFNP